MDFALVEVYPISDQGNIRETFDLAILNLENWPKSRCACPRRDRDQDNYLMEGELGESKEMVYLRLKHLDQREH